MYMYMFVYIYILDIYMHIYIYIYIKTFNLLCKTFLKEQKSHKVMSMSCTVTMKRKTKFA